MNTYTLYFNGSGLYCYRHNDYVSYWQTSAADALTHRLSYIQHADNVYDIDRIIYQSELPITQESHPEYFV